jgi:hypothetical protein
MKKQLLILTALFKVKMSAFNYLPGLEVKKAYVVKTANYTLMWCIEVSHGILRWNTGFKLKTLLLYKLILLVASIHFNEQFELYKFWPIFAMCIHKTHLKYLLKTNTSLYPVATQHTRTGSEYFPLQGQTPLCTEWLQEGTLEEDNWLGAHDAIEKDLG